MDMFRNPKLAARVYECQQEEHTVLELSSSMDIGEHPNVTKLAPSEKVKIGTRTAHSATEQRLYAVFLKKA